MADDKAEADYLEIEIAYAKANEQVVLPLSVPSGTTVEEAVMLSGLLSRFPEISQDELKLGVFGRLCKADQRVKAKDRIEIYRSLLNDPKEARKLRAVKRHQP